MTVNALQLIAEAKFKGNSHLKLLEIAKTLQPDDSMLVWIDINATVDHFGGYYLPADPSLYGINWAIITFAPDISESGLLWCLAEIQARDVEKFLGIPWVFDMALVKIGGIGNESNISPKLSIGFQEAINRATLNNGTLQVIVWMQNSLDLSEKLDDAQGIAYETVHNVSATIEQFGGKLLRAYYEGCYSLLAALPAESIVKIAENPFVKKLYLNGPEGIDVVANHTLITTPKRVNGAYQLRLVEHPQTHSCIDQVRLFAVLPDKTMIELPLISAIHSEYGNVLPQLLSSDEWKTETLGANWNNGTSQSIDLKFRALPPNMKTLGFLFVIEGNNDFYKV